MEEYRLEGLTIKEHLLRLAEQGNKKFTESLNPGVEHVLGIRVPHLRKLAARIEVYLHRVTRFVWNINSWSVCDTFKFGGGKRFVETNKERLWEYLKTWMQAEGEYEIRFGVVMAMQLFIDEEHIGELLSLYNAIRHEGYYVRMGVAWALSVCFVKFPQQTMAYLQQNSLDNFTYNKALQKIVESYRVDAATKDVIRGMKR